LYSIIQLYLDLCEAWSTIAPQVNSSDNEAIPGGRKRFWAASSHQTLARVLNDAPCNFWYIAIITLYTIFVKYLYQIMLNIGSPFHGKIVHLPSKKGSALFATTNRGHQPRVTALLFQLALTVSVLVVPSKALTKRGI
jgi:hypothetical protein